MNDLRRSVQITIPPNDAALNENARFGVPHPISQNISF